MFYGSDLDLRNGVLKDTKYIYHISKYSIVLITTVTNAFRAKDINRIMY